MSADERLHAPQPSIAERDHHVRVRGLLFQDIKTEEARVAQLAKELRYEQADVERLTNGIMGFIERILDDGQLAREQREVLEAQTRLREAQGGLEMLRQQVQGVD